MWLHRKRRSLLGKFGPAKSKGDRNIGPYVLDVNPPPLPVNYNAGLFATFALPNS